MSHQELSDKDSDEYYIDLSLRNIKFYEAYAVDSFLQTTERLHQYLLRNEKRMNRDMQLLRAQWMMARGVYYAALLGRPDSGLVYAKKAAVADSFQTTTGQLTPLLSHSVPRLKGLRAQVHGVSDLPFFMFRCAKIFG